MGGGQGYNILIWSRDRVAGKALREALGAALGAVWATWTAPWTERGLRAPNRRQVRKVKSEARAAVKPDILCLHWARAVVKPNIIC